MHLDGNLIASVTHHQSEERHVRHTQFQFRIRSFATGADPELHASLVELNMIRNVKIDDGKVSFTLVLTHTSPRQFIVEDCQMAVKITGVTDVLVDVTAETPQQKRLAWSDWNCRCQNILAISSGKGGVGKYSCRQCCRCPQQSGAKVGLLDADINAPTICWGFQLRLRCGKVSRVKCWNRL